MVGIGRINRLKIQRIRDYGIYLDGGESGNILLPKRYVPQKCQLGDEVEVFVYMDKEGRLRASTQKPYATVGEFVKLRMVANSSTGAYLDWGLQKDLFVPRSEQHARMVEGKSYVVFIFLDKKTNRITASSRLDKFLSGQSPKYEKGEEVDLFICEKTDLGYKAIINGSHWGVVYKNEVFQKLHIGQQLKGYIKKIREDRKIDLSLQQAGYQQVDGVARSILEKIKELDGRVGVTDKSQPEEIYSLFGVSKKVFKKAIGSLYKKRLVSIDANGVKLARRGKS